jgi:hypothetical protein
MRSQANAKLCPEGGRHPLAEFLPGPEPQLDSLNGADALGDLRADS